MEIVTRVLFNLLVATFALTLLGTVLGGVVQLWWLVAPTSKPNELTRPGRLTRWVVVPAGSHFGTLLLPYLVCLLLIMLGFHGVQTGIGLPPATVVGPELDPVRAAAGGVADLPLPLTKPVRVPRADDHAYAEWKREDAVKFAADQWVTLTRYLIAGAVLVLGWAAQRLEPCRSTWHWAGWLYTYMIAFALASFVTGLYIWFGTIDVAVDESFEMLRKPLSATIYQIVFLVWALVLGWVAVVGHSPATSSDKTRP